MDPNLAPQVGFELQQETQSIPPDIAINEQTYCICYCISAVLPRWVERRICESPSPPPTTAQVGKGPGVGGPSSRSRLQETMQEHRQVGRRAHGKVEAFSEDATPVVGTVLASRGRAR